MEIYKLVMPDQTAYPLCWEPLPSESRGVNRSISADSGRFSGLPGDVRRRRQGRSSRSYLSLNQSYQVVDVAKTTQEYKVVSEYFLASLKGKAHSKVVVRLSRLQNSTVYERFYGEQRTSSATIMFHGCRFKCNERGIISHGFQVSRCESGGRCFGTWFAFAAEYSDAGYAVVDHNGVRHMFICVVSDTRVILDTPFVRVVGQDCAYPFWLISYADQGYKAKLRQPDCEEPELQYEARDGRWVEVSASSKGLASK